MKFKKIEGSSDGGKFVKLKSGEPVRGVCRGEVYEYYQKWIDKKSVIVSSQTPGAKVRFRVNFVVKENNQLVAKILEFGAMISNQLHDMSEDYDLSQTVIKITKSGSGLETTYSVVPLQDVVPVDIKSVSLNILDVEKPAEYETSFAPATSKIPDHLKRGKVKEETPYDDSPMPDDDLPF